MWNAIRYVMLPPGWHVDGFGQTTEALRQQGIVAVSHEEDGVAAFARALGEFGSVVLISGNLPHTEIASQLIFSDVENGAPQAAAAIGVVLLAMALVIFLLLAFVTRRWSRHA